MDTVAQKVSEELKTSSTDLLLTNKDTSSGVTQPTGNDRNTLIGKILSPLHRLSAPWVFNSFNVVILLVILFLLILQPHWKKDKPTPTEISNESTSSQVDGSVVKTQDSELADSQTQQDNGTAVTEIEYADCIKKANELFECKEYEQALMEYNKVTSPSIPPTDEDFFQYRLGECYQKLGRLDDAIAAYQNVVTGYFQSPYLVRARLREGECFIDKGDFLKARKLLFALAAQEARCSDEDKGFVAEAYYKIAESYMKEALRYARIQGYAFANEKQ